MKKIFLIKTYTVLLCTCINNLNAQCISGNCEDGRGVFKYDGGDRYEGQFLEGKRNGQGVYYWASGNKYDGEWLNGEQHGRGIMTYTNGDEYDGYFKNGKRHGYGSLYTARLYVPNCPGCKYYVGDWENGVKSGKGGCHRNHDDDISSLIYSGDFAYDRPIGYYPNKEEWMKDRSMFERKELAGTWKAYFTSTNKPAGYSNSYPFVQNNSILIAQNIQFTVTDETIYAEFNYSVGGNLIAIIKISLERPPRAAVYGVFKESSGNYFRGGHGSIETRVTKSANTPINCLLTNAKKYYAGSMGQIGFYDNGEAIICFTSDMCSGIFFLIRK